MGEPIDKKQLDEILRKNPEVSEMHAEEGFPVKETGGPQLGQLNERNGGYPGYFEGDKLDNQPHAGDTSPDAERVRKAGQPLENVGAKQDANLSREETSQMRVTFRNKEGAPPSYRRGATASPEPPSPDDGPQAPDPSPDQGKGK